MLNEFVKKNKKKDSKTILYCVEKISLYMKMIKLLASLLKYNSIAGLNNS